MTPKYLLDTNILSEPLKPRPDQSVLERLSKHQGEITTCTLVWHELLFGCYRLADSKRRTVIEAYLFEVINPSIPILPYDGRAAHWQALERARLAKSGKTPPFVDGQIAAIAAVNDLTLVTFNTYDYLHFNEIRLEDWRG